MRMGGGGGFPFPGGFPGGMPHMHGHSSGGSPGNEEPERDVSAGENPGPCAGRRGVCGSAWRWLA